MNPSDYGEFPEFPKFVCFSIFVIFSSRSATTKSKTIQYFCFWPNMCKIYKFVPYVTLASLVCWHCLFVGKLMFAFSSKHHCAQIEQLILLLFTRNDVQDVAGWTSNDCFDVIWWIFEAFLWTVYTSCQCCVGHDTSTSIQQWNWMYM